MRRAVELFKALGDETRLRILNLVSQREVCVCEIVEILQLGQSKVSRHLATLRHAGLVDCRRDGMWVIYSLAPSGSPLHEQVHDWLAVIKHQLKDSHNDLQALQEFSEHQQRCQETARNSETGSPQGVSRRVTEGCSQV